MKDWTQYIEKTKGAPPRTLLVRALKEYGHLSGMALDFGCGAMNDTKLLKAAGYDVVALDSHPIKDPPPEYKHSTFEEYSYPLETFDIINAQYSIPFIQKKEFSRIIKALIGSLKSGGVFVGNFFGPHDSWASRLVTVSLEEVKNIFANQEILLLEEKEHDGPAAFEQKHWHVINFIVRKKSL